DGGQASSLFLIGVLSLLCQVVLLRELNVAFYGVELVYLLALTSWMLGTAAGAALLPRRWRAGAGRLGAVLVVVPAALPVVVAAIRASRGWLGGLPGAYLPIDRQLFVLVTATLPLAWALGAAFRWASAASLVRGRSLGWAYGVESAGFAAAGAGSTLAFHLGAQTLPLAVASACLAILAVLARAASRRRPWRWLLLPALAASAWATVSSPGLDARLTALNHPGLRATADSPYGRITVTESGSQSAVFENDVLVYESGGAEQETLAHVTALQHPRPDRILVLGGAVRRLQDALLAHHPSRLVVVEQDPVLAAIAGARLRPSGAAGQQEEAGVPRTGTEAGATVVVADPRRFLRETPDSFDVIVVGAGAPDSGLSNRFYTREFFAACAARLGTGGVLGVELPLPDAFLAPHALRRAASIVAALDGVFPRVEILPGTATLAVASRAALPADEALPTARLRERGIAARLVRPPYLRYLYEGERRRVLPARLRAAGVSANADSRPVCYQYALLIWLSKFFPSIQAVEVPAVSPWAVFGWCMAVAAGAVLVLRRLRAAWRTAALAFLAGLIGMMLETLVLLRYQATRGALFVDIGLLVTAFMAGLSAGSWAAGRTAGTRGGILLPPTIRALAAALAGAAAVAAVAGGAVAGSLAGAAAALAVVGLLVGAVFGCAAARQPLSERAAGGLYAADVVGGAAGSLAATVLLVPLAGLAVTAWLVVGLAAAALVIP
ncbi:MAG: Spermine synthase, partial [Acidobacteria bacterium]|nr:Spermine synthase [Acidobacteriota bacterium]